ncbi:MAG TPA: VWA domain-containing protein [Vicinamibacterales bacterium]
MTAIVGFARPRRPATPAALAGVVLLAALPGLQEPPVLFRAEVDMVDLTATVTDRNGRFVSGLVKDDFVVYDDGAAQSVTRFSQEREAVSLGLLLDASGSMDRGKLQAAQAALENLIVTHLPPTDELFFVEFGFSASLTQEWTTDRSLIRGALRAVRASGDTALYDAVALALPTAQSGRHRKKALVLVSDGNDSRSVVTLDELREELRATDVMVYALAVEAANPLPSERVDVGALRRITDPTGGRTELIRGIQLMDGAVTRVAEELGRQYRLSYARQGPRDGRWHPIRVEVRKSGVDVRTRSGYLAN